MSKASEWCACMCACVFACVLCVRTNVCMYKCVCAVLWDSYPIVQCAGHVKSIWVVCMHVCMCVCVCFVCAYKCVHVQVCVCSTMGFLPHSPVCRSCQKHLSGVHACVHVCLRVFLCVRTNVCMYKCVCAVLWDSYNIVQCADHVTNIWVVFLQPLNDQALEKLHVLHTFAFLCCRFGSTNQMRYAGLVWPIRQGMQVWFDQSHVVCRFGSTNQMRYAGLVWPIRWGMQFWFNQSDEVCRFGSTNQMRSLASKGSTYETAYSRAP